MAEPLVPCPLQADTRSSSSAARSFATAFPRAFDVGLRLAMIAGLRAFAGGDIGTQSDPGDVDAPCPSSVGVASTRSDGDRTVSDPGPSAFKTTGGGVVALATSLLRLPVCTRV